MDQLEEPDDDASLSNDEAAKSTSSKNFLPKFPTFDLEAFIRDDKTMRAFVANGSLKSFAFRRLSFLSSKFSLHRLLNETGESMEQKQVSHRDFYNIRKVSCPYHLYWAALP